jgi:hypothetical protein
MNRLIEFWEDLNLNLPSVAVIVVAFVLEISFVIFMIGSML